MGSRRAPWLLLGNCPKSYDCSGHFVRGLVASVFISLRRDRQLGTATVFKWCSRNREILDLVARNRH
jgi:hypothetical protein